jgi:hypothetical protein
MKTIVAFLIPFVSSTKRLGSLQLREILGNAGHEIARTRNGLGPFAEAFMRVYEKCVRHGKARSAGQSAFVA